MKVQNRMTTQVATIEAHAPISEAIALMKQHSIRHLPVVHGEKLVGWVTEGDIREAFLASIVEDVTVGDIMIKEPVTISANANLEDAAEILFTHRIGGLPVLDGSRLVGIITVADIMAAFIEVMGILTESSRIDVVLGDQPDALENVSKIARDHGSEIISVGMSAHDNRNERVYYLRLTKDDTRTIVDAIEDAGYHVLSYTE
jgi:acetoin utilization protein AcuB